MPQGQIRKAVSGFYYIYADGETYQTRARGNFRNRKITPFVGDKVIFESSSVADGYLLEILPRKNVLVRPPVANVDQAVIVMSCVEPDFSTYLLDRYLILLEELSITPIIYATKTDLLSHEQWKKMQEIQNVYQKIGYSFLLPDSKDSYACRQELIRFFPKNLTVFMGQSGAGKSTLLNHLSPELNLQTGEISQSLGRGRHTTRTVELIPIFEGLVADTPGFSSIDLLEMEKVDLSRYFPEIREMSQKCKFRECLHLHEPNCAVKQAVEKEEIALFRYEHYLQFLNEIDQRKPSYKK